MQRELENNGANSKTMAFPENTGIFVHFAAFHSSRRELENNGIFVCFDAFCLLDDLSFHFIPSFLVRS